MMFVCDSYCRDNQELMISCVLSPITHEDITATTLDNYRIFSKLEKHLFTSILEMDIKREAIKIQKVNILVIYTLTDGCHIYLN